MPPPISAECLEQRIRGFGGGSVRAIHSLIHRAFATRSHVSSPDLPALARVTPQAVVDFARKLSFQSSSLSRLFSPDPDDAAAMVFGAAMDGGAGPDLKDVDLMTKWSEDLAKAHATAIYYLRSILCKHANDVLASGWTMDEVLREIADDGSVETFTGYAGKVQARLLTLARRHALPSVRWGFVIGRLPPGYWSPAHENKQIFADIVEKVVTERGFGPSLFAARQSFARRSKVAVVDFDARMDVGAFMLEQDLREIHCATRGDLDDFLISVAALRASIAKNVWSDTFRNDSSRVGVSLEVYREGGWYPAASARDVAHVLVVTTVSDLDGLRVPGTWLADAYPVAFIAATNASISNTVARAEKALSTATFFAPLSRNVGREFVSTVDPLGPVRAPPALDKIPCAHGIVDTYTVVGKTSRGEIESARAFCTAQTATASEGDMLFEETAVEGAPCLAVCKSHERRSSVGGATCYALDRQIGEWRLFDWQDRGSVHIVEVQKYLGYRGYGRATFLVELYGPNGDFHHENVVAVVSEDRSRLEPRVAQIMDTLEGRFGEVKAPGPPYPPYIRREFELSDSVVSIATDYVSGFASIELEPPLGNVQVRSHTRLGSSYVYQLTSEHSVDVPCEGWGAYADEREAHVRSYIREYWRGISRTACPHDMRMRLTSSTTHVIFDDGRGRVGSKRYVFGANTLRSVWDGRLVLAEERPDAMVYVINNDLPDSSYRLAVVAGYLLTSAEIPLSTARMIHAFWTNRGHTSPHAPVELSNSVGTSEGTDLVQMIDLDAGSAAAWLRQEAKGFFRECVHP